MISSNCLWNSLAVSVVCFVFSSTKIRRAKCSTSAKSAICFLRFAFSIASRYSSERRTNSSAYGLTLFICKRIFSKSIEKYFFAKSSTVFLTSVRRPCAPSFFCTSNSPLIVGIFFHENFSRKSFNSLYPFTSSNPSKKASSGSKCFSYATSDETPFTIS